MCTSFIIKSEIKDEFCWLKLKATLLAFFSVFKYSIEIPCTLHLKRLQEYQTDCLKFMRTIKI